jgi:hypothetical protein
MPFSRFPIAALLAIAAVSPARADEPVNEEFFERKVRPILADRCLECHGKDKQKGGLRLDARESMLKGGDNGPAAVPGDAGKSLLVQFIRYGSDIKMPPKGKLPDEEIAVLTKWVAGGAPWPAATGVVQAGPRKTFDAEARARALWSFQPVRRPAVPEIANDKSQMTNPIDAFLLQKLKKKGLSFAPPASKRALLRRVTFDLIGLPPTPEEIEAFLNDHSPDAYEKVVDRLLASPHYGERWGRHWLDLVRYAETHGHEFDYEIPGAWRYRDYVVRSFNADVPYDRFLTEHIAGDLLPEPRIDPAAGTNESLTATAFWWLGEAKHSPVDSRAEYADRIDNQIDVFGKAVLGLTLACARCHDHKFDPISTKDYYALFGVLGSSRYNLADISDPAPIVKALTEIESATSSLPDSVAPPPKNAVAFERFGDGWRKRWDASGLAFRTEAAGSFPHSGRESEKLTGALRSPTFVIDKPYLAVRVAGRGGQARIILNGLQLIKNPIYGGLAQPVNHGDDWHWVVFDLKMWKGQPAYFELLDNGDGWAAISGAWFAETPPSSKRGGEGETRREGEKDGKPMGEANIPAPKLAPTMRDGNGRNERIFIRGNHKTLGAEAPRAFLEVFDGGPFKSSGSGRFELAKAITDPKNPLTARVLVNRLWKHHFGAGIVSSPDDFGNQGQPPTHPELLDWLATEFMDGGWSIKKMHRLMVLSTAYRQSSRATSKQAAKAVMIDPQNRLLHRQNVRRLEAEAIRDAILAVSGRLDRSIGGPGVLPHLTEHEVGRGRPPSGPLDGNGRRSIYLQVRRNFLNPMFSAFDYPTPFTTIGKRSVSNVPAQALVMLNNPFVLQQAEQWAKRTLAGPGRTSVERLQSMYLAAFARPADPEEIGLALVFLGAAAEEHGNDGKAWADFAHVLFNAKEFIFVE